ncbi:MAG: GNAT family N-acetyltransferase [Candidatus Cloacimonetes bacterium]|nr:GNAT family N-acetyltransferase [Candidatus Cloacimonadota bacterium]
MPNSIEFERLESERIYLKEIEVSELTNSVISWFKDRDLMRYYSNSQKVITKEILIESIQEGKKKGNIYTFGIYTINSNILIGTIKLGPISFVHKTSDLVVLIGDRNFLGKGLSVEAIKLGNKLAFEKFDLRKLFGGMYLSNIPSIKAYTRADWIIEGRLKGYYYVKGKNEDRLLVACFNPKYFSLHEINEIKENESKYY